MKENFLKQLFPAALVAALVVAGAGSTAFAGSESCSNSCVTMAIPSSADGVRTRLDGTADAELWPPSHELRTIRISALNDQGAACDVTIDDVRQDEAPGTAGSGATIADAVDCDNGGTESTVRLRSDRADDGNGRAYQISFRMHDPDCGKSARTDEVLVVVPKDQSVATDLRPAVDEDMLTASYPGSSLHCVPPQRDARLR